jgi:hypothetical protein
MVDQTKMNDQGNGRGPRMSTFHSTRSAARNLAHWLHDAVTLGQLQLRLLALDCRQLRARIGASLIALGFGLVLVLASLLVALAGIALCFHDLAGWSRLESVWATFGIAVVVGGLCVACGIRWMRGASNVFESSRIEWTQNVERLKEMLWRSSHPTEETRDVDTSSTFR